MKIFACLPLNKATKLKSFRSSSLVGHTKSVRPKTNTQHGINDSYMQDVFICKRKTVRGINITMANYKCKNTMANYKCKKKNIEQLLTPTVQ